MTGKVLCSNAVAYSVLTGADKTSLINPYG